MTKPYQDDGYPAPQGVDPETERELATMAKAMAKRMGLVKQLIIEQALINGELPPDIKIERYPNDN